MPNERLQELYAEARKRGMLKENPRLAELVAESVKRGDLKDLSGGTNYAKPAPQASAPSISQYSLPAAGTPPPPPTPQVRRPGVTFRQPSAKTASLYQNLQGKKTPAPAYDAATEKAIAQTEKAVKAQPKAKPTYAQKPNGRKPVSLAPQSAPLRQPVDRLVGAAQGGGMPGLTEELRKMTTPAFDAAVTGAVDPLAQAAAGYVARTDGAQTGANLYQDYINATGGDGGAAGRAFAGGLVPAAGSYAGFSGGATIGARIPGPAPVKAIGGLFGGMAGAFGGGASLAKLQEWLQQGVLTPEVYNKIVAQRALEQKQNPTAVSLGQAATALPFADFNTLFKAPLAERAMEGGVEVLGALGENLITGKPIDTADLIIQALSGAALPGENRLGRVFTGAGERGANALARGAGNVQAGTQQFIADAKDPMGVKAKQDALTKSVMDAQARDAFKPLREATRIGKTLALPKPAAQAPAASVATPNPKATPAPTSSPAIKEAYGKASDATLLQEFESTKDPQWKEAHAAVKYEMKRRGIAEPTAQPATAPQPPAASAGKDVPSLDFLMLDKWDGITNRFRVDSRGIGIRHNPKLHNADEQIPLTDEELALINQADEGGSKASYDFWQSDASLTIRKKMADAMATSTPFKPGDTVSIQRNDGANVVGTISELGNDRALIIDSNGNEHTGAVRKLLSRGNATGDNQASGVQPSAPPATLKENGVQQDANRRTNQEGQSGSRGVVPVGAATQGTNQGGDPPVAPQAPPRATQTAPDTNSAGVKSKRIRTESIAPEEIGILPGVQYKRGVDKNGVTDLLKGQKDYETEHGGTLTAYRDEKGNLYAVDGHHRRELAQRAARFTEPVPGGGRVEVERKLSIQVLDAADGWTPDEVRSIGVLKNLRENKGVAIDAADALVKTYEPEKARTETRKLPQTPLARDVSGLVLLDEPGRALVRNKQVDGSVAAGIGEVLRGDTARQRVALEQAMNTDGVRSYDDGAALARAVRDEEIVKKAGGQESMFGDEVGGAVYQSTAGEQAAIRGVVKKRLAAEQSSLLAVDKTEARAGEVFDTEGRRKEAGSVKDAKSKADALFEYDPEVKAALRQAASDVANGRISRDEGAKRVREVVLKAGSQTLAEIVKKGNAAAPVAEPSGGGLFGEEAKTDSPSLTDRVFSGESVSVASDRGEDIKIRTRKGRLIGDEEGVPRFFDVRHPAKNLSPVEKMARKAANLLIEGKDAVRSAGRSFDNLFESGDSTDKMVGLLKDAYAKSPSFKEAVDAASVMRPEFWETKPAKAEGVANMFADPEPVKKSDAPAKKPQPTVETRGEQIDKQIEVGTEDTSFAIKASLSTVKGGFQKIVDLVASGEKFNNRGQSLSDPIKEQMGASGWRVPGDGWVAGSSREGILTLSHSDGRRLILKGKQLEDAVRNAATKYAPKEQKAPESSVTPPSTNDVAKSEPVQREAPAASAPTSRPDEYKDFLTGKQVWDLTPDEITKSLEFEKTRGTQIEDEILGDDASEWRKMQNMANSMDSALARSGDAAIKRIESKLTQEQVDRLYGMGEGGVDTETLQELKRDYSRISDSETAEELGRSIGRELLALKGKTDMEAMGHKEKLALARVRHATSIATEEGWDFQDVLKSALESASKQFGSAGDFAELMGDYLKLLKVPATAKAETPALSPELEAKRTEVLDVIAKETRNKIGTPVERFEIEGSNGKWYSPNGVPIGVTATDNRRSVGWATQTRDGVFVGNRYPTKEAWQNAQDQRVANEVKGMAETMQTPEDIDRQWNFWVKEKREKKAEVDAAMAIPAKGKGKAPATDTATPRALQEETEYEYLGKNANGQDVFLSPEGRRTIFDGTSISTEGMKYRGEAEENRQPQYQIKTPKSAGASPSAKAVAAIKEQGGTIEGEVGANVQTKPDEITIDGLGYKPEMVASEVDRITRKIARIEGQMRGPNRGSVSPRELAQEKRGLAFFTPGLEAWRKNHPKEAAEYDADQARLRDLPVGSSVYWVDSGKTYTILKKRKYDVEVQDTSGGVTTSGAISWGALRTVKPEPATPPKATKNIPASEEPTQDWKSLSLAVGDTIETESSERLIVTTVYTDPDSLDYGDVYAKPTYGGRDSFIGNFTAEDNSPISKVADTATAPAPQEEVKLDHPVFHEDYTGPRWTYGLQFRPADSFTIPKGFVVGSQRPHSDPKNPLARHGVVDYPRELTPEEIASFDLNPVHTAKDIPALAQRVAAEIGKYLDEYVKPENADIMSQRLATEGVRKVIGILDDKTPLISELRKIATGATPQETKNNEPSSSANLERDSQNADTGNAVGAESLPAGRAADNRGTGGGVLTPQKAGDSPYRGESVPSAEAPSPRKRSDKPVRDAAPGAGVEASTTGSDEPARSDTLGLGGLSPEPISAGAVSRASEGGAAGKLTSRPSVEGKPLYEVMNMIDEGIVPSQESLRTFYGDLVKSAGDYAWVIPKSDYIAARSKAWKTVEGNKVNRETGATVTLQKFNDVVIGEFAEDHDKIIDRAKRANKNIPQEVQPSSSTPSPSSDSFAGLVAKQKAAESVPVKVGDIDNIRETLPVLKAAQQDDVLFAENRFAAGKEPGVLFTNGTGTGKTFTGLGIIKRFERQGKKNILIVAPSQEIIDAWLGAAPHLNLSISQLDDTKGPGDGIVVTTYANLQQNLSLGRRDWDLVLCDEAHKLMSNKDGEDSLASDALQAITLHPAGIMLRTEMLYPEISGPLAEARADRLAAENNTVKSADGEESIVKDVERFDKADALVQNLANELREKREIVKADVEARQADRPKVVFLSATPFAYEKTTHYAEGYLFSYPKEDGSTRTGYNIPTGRNKFMVDNFGWSMKTNQLNQPSAEVDRALLQREFNNKLKREGALSGRALDVPFDYDRKFILAESSIGTKIDQGLKILWEDDYYRPLWHYVQKKFGFLEKRYLLEALKAREAIPIIRQHLALGRKVVLFHDYNKGGTDVSPFDMSAIPAGTTVQVPDIGGPSWSTKTRTVLLTDIAAKFAREHPEFTNMPLGRLQSPIEAIKAAFPDVLQINGIVKKREAQDAVKLFQDDTSGRNLVIVQSAKGAAGISLHDTTGKFQRVQINLGMPLAPTTAIQEEGRIFRVGQASNAIIRYITTGTNWERGTFAQVASKSGEAENLALGEGARALRDQFIQAYMDADAWAPGHEGEGTGGKDADTEAMSVTSAYDRAKTYYFQQMKKTSRTKALEGVDYFATPEPIGFKMVEWLDPRKGESLLEPSAGHAAIARWFPLLNERTLVEPSAELSTKAMAAVPDARVIQDRFENLHIVNKYHGIAMNPPFGQGGKTAIEHLEKAWGHLENGGRIVALLPTGPAADKRLEKWLEESTEIPISPLTKENGGIYKGDTVTGRIRSGMPLVTGEAVRTSASSYNPWVEIKDAQGRAHTLFYLDKVEPTGQRSRTVKARGDAAIVAKIKLPSVVFERAGTSVSTHIVILEKRRDYSSPTREIDLSDIKDIKELFDEIENLSMGRRDARLVKSQDSSLEQPVTSATPKVPERRAKTSEEEEDELLESPSLPMGEREAAAITVPTWATVTGKNGREWLSLKPEIAKAIEDKGGFVPGLHDSSIWEPNPDYDPTNMRLIWKGVMPFIIKSGSGYAENAEDLGARVNKPSWEPGADSVKTVDTLFRGIGPREAASIIKSGKIKSDGSGNLQGLGQEDTTSYSISAGQAQSYSYGIAYEKERATFDKPGYIVEVRKPSMDRVKATRGDEVDVLGDIDASDIVGLWEIRPTILTSDGKATGPLVKKVSPRVLGGSENAPLPAEPSSLHMPATAEADLGAMIAPASARVKIAPIKWDRKPLTDPGKLIDALALATGRAVLVAKQKRGVAGSYRPSDARTSIRWYGAMETTAHEIGHAMDDNFSIVAAYSGKRQRSPWDAELFQQELQATAKTSMNLKLRRAEAVAEWFRAYAVNPAEAERLAPTFTQHVKDTVPAHVLKAFDDFGTGARRLAGAPATEAAMTHIQWGEGDQRSIREKLTETLGEAGDSLTGNQTPDIFKLTFADKLTANFQDSLRPVVAATDWARKLTGGSHLLPENDPILLMRLHADTVGKVGQMLDTGFKDYRGESVIDPDTGEAIGGLPWLLAPISRPSVAETERLMKLTAIQGVAERTLEKGQQLKRDTVLTGIGMGLWSDASTARAILTEQSQLDQETKDSIEEALRRYRLVANSLLGYMADSGRISHEDAQIIMAENQQYISLQRVMEDAPLFEGSGKSRRLATVAAPVKKMGGSMRQLRDPFVSLLDQTYKIVAESDRNRAMDSFVDLFRSQRALYAGGVVPLSQVAAQTTTPSDGKSIKVFHNGKAEHWEINDPQVYAALKGLGTPAAPTGPLKILAKISAGIPRALITGNPAFAIRNFSRDMPERWMKDALGSKPWDSFKKFSEEEKERYALSGGTGMGHYTASRVEYAKAIKAVVKAESKKGTIVRLPSSGALESYHKLLQSAEVQGRLPAYRAAFQHAKDKLGYDDYNAGLFAAGKARDLMDFAVAGNYLRALSPYIPFVNASVQGFAANYKALRRDPAKYLTKFLLLAAAKSLALAIMGMLGKSGADKMEEYRALPAYQRDLCINLPLPWADGWLAIPVGFEAASAAGAIERGLDYAMGNKDAYLGYFTTPTATQDDNFLMQVFHGSLVQSLLPVKPDDLLSLGGLPGAMNEMRTNYDAFRQKSIVPPYETNLPLAERKGASSASRAGKAIAAILKTDPRAVDHLIGSTAGGTGRIVTTLSDLGRADKPLTGNRVLNMATGIVKEGPGFGSPQVQRTMTQLDQAGIRNPPSNLKAAQNAVRAAKTPTESESAKRLLRMAAASSAIPAALELDKDRDATVEALIPGIKAEFAKQNIAWTQKAEDEQRSRLKRRFGSAISGALKDESGKGVTDLKAELLKARQDAARLAPPGLARMGGK